jgi:GMP synthase (glutamine-hydrolysing)
MRTALAINHVAFEDLGTLGDELAAAGFTIEVIDACTANLTAIDALAPDLVVVLGGPIGVYDQASFPFLASEVDLLRRRLAAKRPTLGICLGSQLMASAQGASVYPGKQGMELGWAPIHASAVSSTPPWFAALLAPELPVLHWHGDTFDMPTGATHLAATHLYSNQAFTIGDYALALQFHPEVTAQALERWYVGHAYELSQAGTDVQQLRRDSYLYGPRMEKAARQVWRQWLAHLFQPTAGR